MTCVETFSPELALVDPELAARLRALLPEPGCFRPAGRLRHESAQSPAPSPARRTPEALALPPGVASAGRLPSRRDRRRSLLAVAVVGAGSVAVAGLSVLGFGGGSGTASPDATRQRALADVRSASTYHWPEVTGASGYRAELRRDGTVVFSTFARAPRAKLPPGLRFEPGRYTWTVRPASPGMVGPPVVEETFVVPGNA